MNVLRKGIVWGLLLVVLTWSIGSNASTRPSMMVLYGLVPAIIATTLLLILLRGRLSGYKQEWVACALSVVILVTGYKENEPSALALREVGNLFEDWRFENASGDLWMPYIWCFISKKPSDDLETRLQRDGIALKSRDQPPPSRMVFEFERIGRLRMGNHDYLGKTYEGWTKGNRWVQIFIPNEGEKAFIKVTNRRVE